MRRERSQRVIRQPRTAQSLQRGIGQIVNLIRPTLGPCPRTVAVDTTISGRVPEILDSGGLIARRMLEIADRDEDVGAMLIRNVLWHIHEKVGDGTATAAVLYQTVYDEGLKYIAAGGNAMRLRHYLLEGANVILEQLEEMAMPVTGKLQLSQVALSICFDPPLADLLGEIFDVVGEDGPVEIRAGHGRGLRHEYVEGAYWDSPILSRLMLTDQTKYRTELGESSVLITDLDIENPRELASVIEMVKRAGHGSLMVVANKLSDKTIAMLLANNVPANFCAIAVRTPGVGFDERVAAMEDLETLTGGRALHSAAGDALTAVQFEDLGKVRRAWAERHHFGIIGGQRNRRQVRKHIQALRTMYQSSDDSELRNRIRARIGRLMGGSAVLQVGGATRTDITARKQLAERTCNAIRGVTKEGIVPGGGVWLLACRPPLVKRLSDITDADERAAYEILLRTIEEPVRSIASNGGFEPGAVLARLAEAGTGYGVDIPSGRIVDMARTGIMDSAATQRVAVSSAINGAALALTIDVLVHRKKPEESLLP